MDNIINTIRKLYAKSNSTDSKEEAEAFILKAQELLLKYNIDRSKINERTDFEDGVREYIINLDETQSWQDVLLNAICKNNFCYAINIGEWKFSVIGKNYNIEVVEYMVNFFIQSIMKISVNSYVEYLNKLRMDMAESGINIDVAFKKRFNQLEKKYIEDFLNGSVHGFIKKLKEKKEQAMKDSNTMALVLVNDKAINRYIKEKYPSLKNGRKMKKRRQYRRI